MTKTSTYYRETFGKILLERYLDRETCLVAIEDGIAEGLLTAREARLLEAETDRHACYAETDAMRAYAEYAQAQAALDVQYSALIDGMADC